MNTTTAEDTTMTEQPKVERKPRCEERSGSRRCILNAGRHNHHKYAAHSRGTRRMGR